MWECHYSPYDIRSLVQVAWDSERKSHWPLTNLLIMMLKRADDNAIEFGSLCGSYVNQASCI